MAKSTIFLIILLALVAGLLGYNYFAQPFADLDESSAVQVSPLPAPAALLWEELSAQHKVAQLLAYPYEFDLDQASQAAQLNWLKSHQLGAVTLFGDRISTGAADLAVTQINSLYQPGFLPLIGVDHEGGSVQRLSGTGFTQLPSWRELCGLNSDQQVELLTASANELSKLGVDLVYAPVVDVASSSGRLGSRTCSADPDVIIDMASLYIEVFRKANIISTIKHFPGIGQLGIDLHTTFGNVSLSDEEVLMYSQLLENYPQLAVMVTHAGIEGELVDQPCSLNSACVGQFSQFFPEILVISDALDMSAAREDSSSLAEIAVQAIEAGNNLLLFGPNTDEADLSQTIDLLATKYENDEVFQTQVDRSLEKLWLYRQLFL